MQNFWSDDRRFLQIHTTIVRSRGVYASWDALGYQKTPEMSELESDKYAVKIWAYNSKKQKS